MTMVTLPGGKLNISMSLIHIINTHRMIQSLALLSSSAQGRRSWNYARTSPAPGKFGAHMSEGVGSLLSLGIEFSSFPSYSEMKHCGRQRIPYLCPCACLWFDATLFLFSLVFKGNCADENTETGVFLPHALPLWTVWIIQLYIFANKDNFAERKHAHDPALSSTDYIR